MISYFDTSVLFPAVCEAHSHHSICAEAFTKAALDGKIVCLSTHVYAELYGNLTRFPIKRVSPKEADDTIMKLMEVVQTIDLSKSDYQKAVHRCSSRGLISGVIYDALHLQAAIKAKVGAFYTANVKDFERLWDEEIGFELRGI